MREEAAVQLDVAALVPLAHWITPSSEPKRYDTHFFLARMPAGQVAKHDESETVAHLWATPVDILERNARGEMKLPPPTIRTLEELAPHATFAAARAWAEQRPRLPIMPKMVPEGETLVIVLPWDPAYAGLPGDGDAIDPAHPVARGRSSRFVLEEGRWWGRPPPAR